MESSDQAEYEMQDFCILVWKTEKVPPHGDRAHTFKAGKQFTAAWSDGVFIFCVWPFNEGNQLLAYPVDDLDYAILA